MADLIQAALQFHAQGDLASAERVLTQAVSASPTDANALHLLALIKHQRGSTADALPLLERSLALAPNHAGYWSNAGEVYRVAGLREKAEHALRQAILLQPALPQAHANLGLVLEDAGRLDDALTALRQSLVLAPTEISTRAAYARLLLATGKLADALREAESVLRDDPGQLETLIVQGACHEAMGRPVMAEEALRRAISLDSKTLEAWTNLGNALRSQGRLTEANAAHARAVQIAPQIPAIHSNQLFALLASDNDAHGVFAAHREFGRRHEAAVPMTPHVQLNNARPRIGFVSPDFRKHAVAYFFSPLLEFADRERFDLYCYAASHANDSVTRKLMSLATGGRNISAFTDAQAADLIRGDKIDLLIDLAGHTAFNRLSLFARKPAPVQATYLGYPGTTGMTCIDWRITDGYADPPGLTEPLHTERLHRVPFAWCYQPPSEAPEARCEISDGGVVFGSFANVAKWSDATIELWAKVLHATADSKLLLKAAAMHEPAVRERYLSALERLGVTRERIEIVPAVAGFAQHLAVYNRIDISLDTLPYAGTATTCEALWMGVPVITLAGQAHISRVGISLLTAAGNPEQIAKDADGFVRIAARLAGELDRSNPARSARREALRHSALMDAQRFTRDMETAYQSMLSVPAT